ncbi:periplasmic chaperone for outer membrane proteins SurA [Gulbenkiania indica]|uniref:Chaperone SurA n=1 Tax=Gulbenkiania indica TaxID=375574 RepID=A0A0K6GZ10_9NEIS|nr:peptidylprolyl isomerase [Gulbenkiania indica]CUA83805.1 periplasmic chaperone for outer membrane proteins SurA [Gulbenkiania indica]
MTMKKSLLALILAAALGSAVAAAPVRPVDRIVAVVNKSVITELQLKQRMAEASANLAARKISPPEQSVLARQVLEQMITEEAQVQFAQNNGVTVDPAELDQAIARVAQQNKMDIPALEAQLAKEGVSLDRFREDLRRQMLVAKLREREVEARVTVTDTEIEQVLKSSGTAHRGEFRISAILVSVPERADAKQIETLQQKAGQALAELRSGQPFAKVAASYSDGPNALQGGDLGWRPANSLPTELVQMLDKLKPGENTGLIRTAQGFYIFRMEEKRDQSGPVMAEQYHTRHILIRANEAVSDADARARLVQIRDRIQRGASFAEMARLYSEDASNTKGGDLGWVNLGDTVPDFEKVMVSLPQGSVSEPVRSPFGWHLILVEGKRTQDVSSERERMLVRQQIRTRKIDQAYADWVRQVRDAAFVEDRLEEK